MDDLEREEKIYRWTVRSLYVLALALNAFAIWQQVKDTPEGEALEGRIEKVKKRIRHPFEEARHFRKQANEVVFEAITIVEESEEE